MAFACTTAAAPKVSGSTRRERAAQRRQCVAAAARPAAAAAAAADGDQLGRRSTLLAALQAAAALLVARPAAAADAVTTVGPGGQYATLGAALAATPAGGTIEVAGGRYPERLVITKPVTIRAAPGQAVELSWDSNQPYEATVEVDAAANPGAGLEAPGAVVLQGLRLRHSSPSVANNYAVRLAGCGAVLIDCDVTSSTGDGVGVEGGAPRLQGCTVHDCVRHGVAVFGDLLGGGCAAVLDGCAISGNRLSGLLVRDGASPAVQRCTLAGNGEWGLRLLDAGGRYEGNEIAANAKGSVAYTLLFDEVDTAQMVVRNKLDRPVQSLGRM